MEEDNVDALVTGLVREYLYRKGLTEVLRIFDEETVSMIRNKTM